MLRLCRSFARHAAKGAAGNATATAPMLSDAVAKRLPSVATVLARRRPGIRRKPIFYKTFCPWATMLDHARADSNPAGLFHSACIYGLF